MGDCKIYNIPSSVSFVDALAEGVLQRYGNEGSRRGSLSEVLLLLPNRRSCRTLQEAFLRKTEGQALLLPKMRAIGDTDESELLIASSGSAALQKAYSEIPPAISDSKRKFLLAELIHGWNPAINHEQATFLAHDLASFLDEVQREGLSFDMLEGIVPEELAQHWQVTLDFFSLLSERWPVILKELSMIDPVDRRNRLVELQIQVWQGDPPDYPVITSGTTGSILSTILLLKEILNLEEGEIILPGLDKNIDDNVWIAIDENHPQFGLKRLLSEVGMTRHDIQDWPPPSPTPLLPREKLLSHIMIPSQCGDLWQSNNSSVTSAHIENISRIDAENTQEEASIIALIMRSQLEHKGKTAALVTHDRKLSGMVRTSLRRWNIIIDDSAGQPMAQLPQVVFMRLVIDAVASDFAPVSLLALLKHPLAAGNMETAEFRKLARLLERHFLRGVRTTSGVSGICTLIETSEHISTEKKSALLDFMRNIAEITANFGHSLKRNKIELNQLIIEHISCTELLSESNKNTTEQKRLWQGNEGQQVAEYIAEFIDSSANHEITNPAGFYAGIFDALWIGKNYQPKYGAHPRLAILSPMEARLQHYDLMILGGMNEGSWPAETSNPWMSKAMRENFGLPSLARRVGLSAHDFVHCASAPEVMITRAQKQDGSPATPSQWLLRLDAVLESAGLKDNLQPEQPWREWAAMLNQPEKRDILEPPAPKPPAEARPQILSVTQIEKLMRDPYSVYANKILKLKKLDDIDSEPGMAEFGDFVHATLDSFISEYHHLQGKGKEEQITYLLETGREILAKYSNRPAIYAMWWPRFEHIAEWFVENEITRRANNKNLEIYTELEGSINIAGITLTARADRIEIIDRNREAEDAGKASGKVSIIDYKTGTVPQKGDVMIGFSPQLPLEAIIAESGGFESLPATTEATELSHWKLSGGNKGGEINNLKDLRQAIDAALEGVTKLLTAFTNPDTPYLPCPNPDKSPSYNDYEHLERVKEWGV